MRRPHSHADEFQRRHAPIDETPLFRAPAALTEAQFLAKWLRGSAAYHRQHGGRVEASLDLLAALKRLGVALEPPVSRTAGELSTDQADRYADALDPRQEGAA